MIENTNLLLCFLKCINHNDGKATHVIIVSLINLTPYGQLVPMWTLVNIGSGDG